MTKEEVQELEESLRMFRIIFDGRATNYAAGGWSRRNLDALIGDVEEVWREMASSS